MYPDFSQVRLAFPDLSQVRELDFCWNSGSSLSSAPQWLTECQFKFAAGKHTAFANIGGAIRQNQREFVRSARSSNLGRGFPGSGGIRYRVEAKLGGVPDFQNRRYRTSRSGERVVVSLIALPSDRGSERVLPLRDQLLRH